MKSVWKTKILREVCVVDKCQGLYKNLPYVGLEHIESQTGRFVGATEPLGVKSSTFKFSPEHVLYGRLRPYLNKVMLPDFRGHCSTEIYPIKPLPGLLREFLQYWFLMDATVEQIDATSTGARMPRANMNAVLDFVLPLPPPSEQHRIVGILDEAFEGIATAKANAEKNLQNARALFESHLQSVFTQRGEGWVEKQLGDVAELVDCLHKTPFYVESGFPMVRVTDIKPGILDLRNTRKVDQNTFIEFSKKHTPKPGDIVFSRVGTYGISSLVNSNELFCLGQNTVFIVPKINPLLLYHFLNSPNAKEQIDGFVDGTTQPTISLKSIRNISVPIAPLCDQQKLLAELDGVTLETGRLRGIYQQKLAALDKLKKSLLHQAFSGQL